jgi:hypothetical protein
MQQAGMRKQGIERPVSARRRRRQKGIEAIEFGLFFVMMLPGFIWMFISGMNFIRFNKANDVARATALMYVKGQDMAVLGTQEIIARVGQGLGLEVDNGATPPNQQLSNSRGSGLVIVSQVQYVGPNTCTGCPNINNYVFLQRVYIGNTGLQFNGSTVQSALGNPSTNVWSATTGAVSNAFNDPGALVNSSFASLWTPTVGDGQLVYVVESYFAGGFGEGQFGGGGVYARVFM